MSALIASAVISYGFTGLVSAYFVLRHHAKRHRVDKDDVIGCSVINMLFWPVVVPCVIWQEMKWNPIQKVADYFNRIHK